MMPEYAQCNDCKTFIHLLTRIHTHKSNTLVKIENCPHCGSDDIKKITSVAFDNVEHTLFMRAKRRYWLMNNSIAIISFQLKFIT